MLSQIELNGVLATELTVAPGQDVKIKANWADSHAGCQGCIDQTAVAFAGNPVAGCIQNTMFSDIPRSGTGEVDLGPAPKAPGTYNVAALFEEAFHCGEFWNASASTGYQVIARVTVPLPVPTSKEQCKHGGWKNYGTMFKNQGQCVSFVVHGEHAKRHRHHRHAGRHRGSGPEGPTGATGPTEGNGATGATGPTGTTGPGNTMKPAYSTSDPALCLKGRLGYPGVLLTQQGAAFKNFVHCLVYAGAGGQLVGVNALAEPAAGGSIKVSFSGFGLKPGTEVFDCAKYSPPGVNGCPSRNPIVAADGQFEEELFFDCEFKGSQVASLYVQATTADGTSFTREFSPSGC
jgi:hypothetical protein